MLTSPNAAKSEAESVHLSTADPGVSDIIQFEKYSVPIIIGRIFGIQASVPSCS